MPNAEELAASGITTFTKEPGSELTLLNKGKGRGKNKGKGKASEHQEQAEPLESEQVSKQLQPLVAVGQGFQALPRKLVERIQANEYVDFADLPPAKGKSRPASHSLEGQVLVVQAADLVQARKVIPDLATWLQCFAMYTAVLVKTQPQRAGEMMAYQALIAKASQKYKWPSWIVYDQNVRLEVAGNTAQSWARVEPSIYALSFTGQAISNENWCARCQCLDHTASNCPAQPRKRPWGMAMGQAGPTRQDGPVCMNFNRFDGDCKFGARCKFVHACSVCRESHPVSRCKASRRGGPPEKEA